MKRTLETINLLIDICQTLCFPLFWVLVPIGLIYAKIHSTDQIDWNNGMGLAAVGIYCGMMHMMLRR